MNRDAWAAGAALALLAGGLALAAAMRGPGLTVRARQALTRHGEALAAYAALHDGQFPEDAAGLAQALAGSRGPATDPWRHPWRYARVAPRGPIRLWSSGPDGRDDDGAGDDVTAW